MASLSWWGSGARVAEEVDELVFLGGTPEVREH